MGGGEAGEGVGAVKRGLGGGGEEGWLQHFTSLPGCHFDFAVLLLVVTVDFIVTVSSITGATVIMAIVITRLDLFIISGWLPFSL